MSQTPLQESDAVESYAAGWASMGWLTRQGLSWSGPERNVCFLGTGEGRFLEAGGALGLDFADDGRSVARVDWDMDGDLDLLLRSRSTPRLRFLENRVPRRGNWIAVKPVATASALGARLEVQATDENGQEQIWMRSLRAGEGYLSQSSEWLHVGIGQSKNPRVDIVWPGGERESFGPAAAGKAWIAVQGEGRSEEYLPAESGGGQGGLREFAGAGTDNKVQTQESSTAYAKQVGAAGRYVLATPYVLPSLAIKTSRGGELSLGGVLKHRQGDTPKPLVLMLWSADCAPCLSELEEWSQAKNQVEAHGLSVLALELKPQTGAQLTGPSNRLAQLGWPYPQAELPPESAHLLHALAGYFTDSTRPLALPMSLLIDGHGQIQALYWGRVSPQTAMRDIGLFDLTGPDRLRKAMPFDGLFLDPPKRPDWLLASQFLRTRGLEKSAEELEWALVRTTDVNGAEAQFQMGMARLRQGQAEQAKESLLRVVEMAPAIPRYQSGLADCLLTLGETEGAREHYGLSLVGQPRQPKVLFELGKLQVQAGDLGSAHRTLGSLRPLDVGLARDLGRILEAQQAIEQDAAQKDASPSDSVPR